MATYGNMALQNEDFSDVMNQVNQMRASGRTLGPNTVRDLLAAKMKAAQAERLAQRQSDIQAESVQNTKDYQTGSLALGNTAEADKISEGALNRTAAADLADKSRSSAAWTGAGSLAASLAMMDAQGGWKGASALGDAATWAKNKLTGPSGGSSQNEGNPASAENPIATSITGDQFNANANVGQGADAWQNYITQNPEFKDVNFQAGTEQPWMADNYDFSKVWNANPGYDVNYIPPNYYGTDWMAELGIS